MVLFLLLQSAYASFEVIPAKVDVEAGGGASQILVRGAGAEQLQSFDVLVEGKRTSYLLARAGAKGSGQITVVLQARDDAPRNLTYQLATRGQVLPLKIRLVDPGEAVNTGRPSAPDQDIRETVRAANSEQVVVSVDQAPQVLRTVPVPLRIAPDGESKRVQLIGKRLETVEDVRVRKADQPPKYRGKQGKLPFTYRDGILEVELMASRKTAVGEKYALDLMVGKFRALTVGFEIGELLETSVQATEPMDDGPMVIELAAEASAGTQ